MMRNVGTVAVGATLAMGVACATEAEQSWLIVGSREAPIPSRIAFEQANVSLFLERKCGSLDCHGQPERPLRILGPNGLRIFVEAGDDAGIDAGAAGLSPLFPYRTALEIDANYSAVVGLEPEVLPRVLAARTDDQCRLPGEGVAQVPMIPDVGAERCLHRLLIVSKPLGCGPASLGCSDGIGVEHKGGPVIARGGPGYECLIGWLRGRADPETCWRAAGERPLPAKDAGL